MAVANFFDKAVLSAASAIRGASSEEIRRHLLSHPVCLAFDAVAATSPEGRAILELCANLLARLYPRLAIVDLSPSQRSQQRPVIARLIECAREINPEIEIENELGSPVAGVVVGSSRPDRAFEANGLTYVGSDGWEARWSRKGPVLCGGSLNPFGAGVAACIGAAAVFQTVFGTFLNNSPRGSFGENTIGDELSLSPIDMIIRPVGAFKSNAPPIDTAVNVGETFLVGVGAIGNAAIWALSRAPGLCGLLRLIDPEKLELSNLQRYVLARQEDTGGSKSELAKAAYDRARAPTNAIVATDHIVTWRQYAAARGDYLFDRVLLALDSAQARMDVQGSLPRWIANAWTQPENLGVSRHGFTGESPCVCCLYMGDGSGKNKDTIYAEAMGMTSPQELLEVRRLLHSGAPVGRGFISRLCERLVVPEEELMKYSETSLDGFYADAICGGVVFRLGAEIGRRRPAEVPTVFQSALAGILLAAELVIDAGGLRSKPLAARTEIDLIGLRIFDPVGVHLNTPDIKHRSGRCICQDPTYQRAYAAKYA